jgi:hypothetical protein
MASDTEVDPLIHSRFTRLPKSLNSGTRVLWAWKFWGHARDGANRHAGGATDTNIGIIFGPTLFIKRHGSTLFITSGVLLPQIANPKSQIPNKFQMTDSPATNYEITQDYPPP